MRQQEFAPGQAVSAAELAQAGLLRVDEGAHVSQNVVFVPADQRGTARQVRLGAGCGVESYAVIYGGTIVRPGARIEEHSVVGKPERGYAVGHVYPGAGRAPSSARGRCSARGRWYMPGPRSARTWPWGITRCCGPSSRSGPGRSSVTI